MIYFKNNKIRVRCIECKGENFIEMNHFRTEKEQRSVFDDEYEHEFRGNLKCIHCGEEMKLEILVYEYPKDFVNFTDESSESCLIMDEIYRDDFEAIIKKN